MDSLAYIAPWVFGSICVGMLVGFYAGRGRPDKDEEVGLAQSERQATLKVLVDLLSTAERMTSDVECHNTEIQQTAENVGNLDASGEAETVKQALLGQIAGLLTSNRRLEDDLKYSRYRMEEQAEEIDDARREARTDPLTGVSNRKAFDEKFHLLHTTWRRQGQPYVLILADLDKFKRINDCHGHQTGDRVLQKLGSWLKQWVREGDFVGRYGGDEFAILLPHTELDVGTELAEAICSRAGDETSRIAVRGEQVTVSLSIGVSSPSDRDSLESIMQRADQALYRSKNLGRNQVNCQQPPREEESSATETVGV